MYFEGLFWTLFVLMVIYFFAMASIIIGAPRWFVEDVDESAWLYRRMEARLEKAQRKVEKAKAKADAKAKVEAIKAEQKKREEASVRQKEEEKRALLLLKQDEERVRVLKKRFETFRYDQEKTFSDDEREKFIFPIIDANEAIMAFTKTFSRDHDSKISAHLTEACASISIVLENILSDPSFFPSVKHPLRRLVMATKTTIETYQKYRSFDDLSSNSSIREKNAKQREARVNDVEMALAHVVERLGTLKLAKQLQAQHALDVELGVLREATRL